MNSNVFFLREVISENHAHFMVDIILRDCRSAFISNTNQYGRDFGGNLKIQQ